MNDAVLPVVNGLDTARGLRLFAGQAAIYREALGDFVSLYADGIPGAVVYLSEPSPERLVPVKRAVHSLGGAGAALGAVEIERLAKEFEAAVRNRVGESDRGPHILLDSLMRELAALVEALRLNLRSS